MLINCPACGHRVAADSPVYTRWVSMILASAVLAWLLITAFWLRDWLEGAVILCPALIAVALYNSFRKKSVRCIKCGRVFKPARPRTY